MSIKVLEMCMKMCMSIVELLHVAGGCACLLYFFSVAMFSAVSLPRKLGQKELINCNLEWKTEANLRLLTKPNKCVSVQFFFLTRNKLKIKKFDFFYFCGLGFLSDQIEHKQRFIKRFLVDS